VILITDGIADTESSPTSASGGIRLATAVGAATDRGESGLAVSTATA
jgi:hypothetical protein